MLIKQRRVGSSLAALLVFAAQAAAQETTARFYVSLSGNDQHDGSQKRPWRTLSHAARAAPSGSTVHASGGTFTDTVVVSGKRLRFVGRMNGSGRGPVIKAQPDSAPTIRIGSKLMRVHSAFVATGSKTVLDLENFNIYVNRRYEPHVRIAVVFADGASGSVEDCWFGGDPSPYGYELDHAVATWGRDAKHPSNVDLIGNWIWAAKDSAVSFVGEGVSGKIRKNAFWGSRESKFSSPHVGLAIDGGNSFVIEENSFLNYWPNSPQFRAHAIRIRRGRTGAISIAHNTIEHCDVGIDYESARTKPASIVGNRMANARIGMIVRSSRGRAEGNDFDCWQSLRLANAASFQLHANRYADFATNPGWPREYRAPGMPTVRDSIPVRSSVGFEAALELRMPQGSRPNDLALGDFDGNGSPDVAVANHGTRSIRILFGPAARTLQACKHVDIHLAGKPLFLVGGEFSGSRGLDLAIIDDEARITLLTNDGQGGFAASKAIEVVSNARAHGVTALRLRKANLDARGCDDLAVGLRLATTEGTSDRIVPIAVKASGLELLSATSLRRLGDFAVADLDDNGRDEIIAVDNPAVSQPLSFCQVVIRHDSARTIRQRLNGTMRVTRLEVDSSAKVSWPDETRFALICERPAPALSNFSIDKRQYLSGLGTTKLIEPGCSRLLQVDLQREPNRSHATQSFLVLNPKARKATVFERRYRSRSTSTGKDPSAVASTDLNDDGLPDLVFANRGDDSVSVVLSRAIGFIAIYGSPCAASGNYPYILTHQVPKIGNRDFAINLAAKPQRTAVLFCSIEQRDLKNTCAVLIGTPSASFFTRINDLGRARVAIPIPAHPALIGSDLYFQMIVSEPKGPVLDAFVMSQGLHVRIGDPILNY